MVKLNLIYIEKTSGYYDHQDENYYEYDKLYYLDKFTIAHKYLEAGCDPQVNRSTYKIGLRELKFSKKFLDFICRLDSFGYPIYTKHFLWF